MNTELKLETYSRGVVRLDLVAVLLAVIAIVLAVYPGGHESGGEGADAHQPAQDGQTYTITARFDNIGNIKQGSAVTASGVAIGRVSSIDYDSETYEAVVGLSINRKHDRFPLDTAASVLTTGFSGEKYIDLQPGAEDIMLKQGDNIDLTQSALILEQVIGQFIYNQAQDSSLDSIGGGGFDAPEFDTPEFGGDIEAIVPEHESTEKTEQEQ